MKTSALIEANALQDALQHGGCAPVDCRFVLTGPEAGFAAYMRAHIPQARYVNLDRDLSAPPRKDQGRHPLPRPSRFARCLSELGIANTDHIVAYDDAGGAIAARLWWLLRWIGHERVSVLNGGLQAWQAAGFALESGQRHYAHTDFQAAPPHENWVVATAELAALRDRGCPIIDARSAERFAGVVEPLDPVAGHIPGAVNCPYQRLLGSDGRLLEPSALRALFEDEFALGDRTEAVAMCGSGVTACHLLLGLHCAGIEGGRLYAGSWSEWIRDPSRPVASGPEESAERPAG